MHATAYLKNPDQHETGPIVVLSGEERFLKQQVIHLLTHNDEESDSDLDLIRMTGKDADLKTVRDELSLVSMWSDRRVVLIEAADDFVSAYRAGLEKLLEHPPKKSLLILDVKSWPGNTRLAKSVVKIGLPLECKTMSAADLSRWLVSSCKDTHDKKLSRAAADLMVELAGTNLGQLEQELEKLVSYVGERNTIDPADVNTLVGGWRAETTWVMLNSLRDNQVGEALAALDQLLVSGEAPQKILGGIHFVFRKIAKATELARQGTSLNTALKQAGVFPRDVAATAQYLRAIGRPAAELMSQRLITIDGNMKGNSRMPERIQLEQLLVQLSALSS